MGAGASFDSPQISSPSVTNQEGGESRFTEAARRQRDSTQGAARKLQSQMNEICVDGVQKNSISLEDRQRINALASDYQAQREELVERAQEGSASQEEIDEFVVSGSAVAEESGEAQGMLCQTSGDGVGENVEGGVATDGGGFVPRPGDELADASAEIESQLAEIENRENTSVENSSSQVQKPIAGGIDSARPSDSELDTQQRGLGDRQLVERGENKISAGSYRHQNDPQFSSPSVWQSLAKTGQDRKNQNTPSEERKLAGIEEVFLDNQTVELPIAEVAKEGTGSNLDLAPVDRSIEFDASVVASIRNLFQGNKNGEAVSPDSDRSEGAHIKVLSKTTAVLASPIEPISAQKQIQKKSGILTSEVNPLGTSRSLASAVPVTKGSSSSHSISGVGGSSVASVISSGGLNTNDVDVLVKSKVEASAKPKFEIGKLATVLGKALGFSDEEVQDAGRAEKPFAGVPRLRLQRKQAEGASLSAKTAEVSKPSLARRAKKKILRMVEQATHYAIDFIPTGTNSKKNLSSRTIASKELTKSKLHLSNPVVSVGAIAGFFSLLVGIGLLKYVRRRKQYPLEPTPEDPEFYSEVTQVGIQYFEPDKLCVHADPKEGTLIVFSTDVKGRAMVSPDRFPEKLGGEVKLAPKQTYVLYALGEQCWVLVHTDDKGNPLPSLGRLLPGSVVKGSTLGRNPELHYELTAEGGWIPTDKEEAYDIRFSSGWIQRRA